MLSLGGALLGVVIWRQSQNDSQPPVDEATPAAASSLPSRSAPLNAAMAPISARAFDPAEQLLRELEPLSVTDRPAALARALEADARLPAQGVMAEARRALIVTLMVDTQRMSDARARAREFIQHYPDSRYLPLVKGVTGIHPRPRPSEQRDARRTTR
jgi:hypothetical protein